MLAHHQRIEIVLNRLDRQPSESLAEYVQRRLFDDPVWASETYEERMAEQQQLLKPMKMRKAK